jgi:hypothetical protein
MRFNLIMITAALVTPAAAGAQANLSIGWPVAVGSRVRIVSPVLGDQRQTGTVASSSADTLLFHPAKDASSIALATPNIVRMEVASGTHTRKLKGALIGLLTGAGAGAAIGAASYKKPKPCYLCFLEDSRGFDAALGGTLLGIVGAAVGTLIGARQTDTWVPVAIPRSVPTP